MGNPKVYIVFLHYISAVLCFLKKDLNVFFSFNKIGKSSDDDLDFGVGFVYPYSRSKKAKSKFKQQWPWKVKNPEEAEKALEFAIPREFKTFTFKQENMQSFQDFIVNSYYESSPPR